MRPDLGLAVTGAVEAGAVETAAAAVHVGEHGVKLFKLLQLDADALPKRANQFPAVDTARSVFSNEITEARPLLKLIELKTYNSTVPKLLAVTIAIAEVASELVSSASFSY
ncbi:hypothetical protein L914_06694 [Phytophthora nicotianae]|uniref:Uncharacterized protein n=1 Tax=Phytophthora nicotianae TaxID=4792 RepID=W2J7W3_PHYNI|nr:hypothetical protein L916_06725 [Phytophthora nicotianae]ETM48833.1 hypothetical protein L914_06694 [Phytophthora nicotianae]